MSSASEADSGPRAAEPDPEAAPPAEKALPSGLRAKVRSKPGFREAYRILVFLVGLLFIAAGIALATLPGPLTIPPVLLGLWIWSTEFRFAERLFDKFKAKGNEAWDHAKEHPVSSTIITVGGLILAGAAFWAVVHYDLVAKAKDAVF